MREPVRAASDLRRKGRPVTNVATNNSGPVVSQGVWGGIPACTRQGGDAEVGYCARRVRE